MAMTVAQAEQIVRAQAAPAGGPPDVPPPGSSGGGGGDSGEFVPIPGPGEPGYDPKTNTDFNLPPGWVINHQTGNLIPPGTTLTGGIGIPMGALFDVGGTVYRWNGKTITKATVAETKTYWATGGGISVDDSGAHPTTPEEAATTGSTGGGGGGSYATSQDYLQQQQALAAARDAEAMREFDLTRQSSETSSRASSGLNLGDLVRALANDSYQRALDPGNYPAYLAASAGLPQGTGSPISALIGQGVQIQSPEGANPLADPRFQNLLGNLYEYAQPGAVGTVQAIANQNGGQLPQAFYDYTHTQNPNVPQHAAGGSQILNEPVVGMGMQSGRPLFLAGEAGQERINFTPMHQHETEGMPTPHQHDGGDASHEHMGQMIRYADGGTAITGISPTRHQLISAWNAYHPNEQQQDDTFTPAEGTAMSLGKALQPLGYVPPYLIQQLMEGRTPTPGSIDEATLSRLPPSLRALLQAQIKSALGSAGLMDYNFQLDQNALPGLNNNGITSTVYSG